MIISEKLGVIFVHIPRTGGWSMAYQLSKMAENDQDYSPVSRPESSYYPGLFRHASAAQIKASIDPDLWARCFKFAFVRNPWDRLASMHTYKCKHHGVMDPFADWLDAYGGEGPYMDFPEESRSQSDYLYDAEGKLLVDYVGRFETMTADVDAIMQRLQPSVSLHRHLNQSIRRNFRRLYDKTLLERANPLCLVDAERFGYTFGALSAVEIISDELNYQRGHWRKRFSLLKQRLRNRLP